MLDIHLDAAPQQPLCPIEIVAGEMTKPEREEGQRILAIGISERLQRSVGRLGITAAQFKQTELKAGDVIARRERDRLAHRNQCLGILLLPCEERTLQEMQARILWKVLEQ